MRTSHDGARCLLDYFPVEQLSRSSLSRCAFIGRAVCQPIGRSGTPLGPASCPHQCSVRAIALGPGPFSVRLTDAQSCQWSACDAHIWPKVVANLGAARSRRALSDRLVPRRNAGRSYFICLGIGLATHCRKEPPQRERVAPCGLVAPRSKLTSAFSEIRLAAAQTVRLTPASCRSAANSAPVGRSSTGSARSTARVMVMMSAIPGSFDSARQVTRFAPTYFYVWGGAPEQVRTYMVSGRWRGSPPFALVAGLLRCRDDMAQVVLVGNAPRVMPLLHRVLAVRHFSRLARETPALFRDLQVRSAGVLQRSGCARSRTVWEHVQAFGYKSCRSSQGTAHRRQTRTTLGPRRRSAACRRTRWATASRTRRSQRSSPPGRGRTAVPAPVPRRPPLAHRHGTMASHYRPAIIATTANASRHTMAMSPTMVTSSHGGQRGNGANSIGWSARRGPTTDQDRLATAFPIHAVAPEVITHGPCRVRSGVEVQIPPHRCLPIVEVASEVQHGDVRVDTVGRRD